MRLTLLAFALLLSRPALAWEGTHAVDLSGGSRVSFGDRVELNGLERWTTLIGIYRKGSGWFSGSRVLVGRSGAGKRQLDIRVWPHGGLGALRIGVADAPNGTFRYRHVADQYFVGRVPYLIAIAFDRGQVRVQVNGVEVPTTGDELPTKLTSVSGADLTIGGTDLLQETVFHHAWWLGRALPKTQLQGLWCQNRICDLGHGYILGPTDAQIELPPPTWHWPIGSGDDLPTISPRVGDVFGLVIPGPGALVTTIPVPHRIGADAVAFERFRLTTGLEIGEPRAHTGFPGAALVGSDVLACYSRGNDHSASADQDLEITWSRDLGHTWPIGGKKAWPGFGDVETTLVDIAGDGNARACGITRLRSGRLFVEYNYCPSTVCAAGQGTTQNRFRYAAISDDGGKTWSAPYALPIIGTHYASAGGSGGSLAYRSDGCVSDAVYWRNLGEVRYCAGVITSCDEASPGSWAVTGTIACDASPNGRQYEEPFIGPAGDGSWIAMVRVDDTRDTLLYRSWDEGETWEYESVALDDGANGAAWIRLGDGTLLTANRSWTTKGGFLAWSHDFGHSWVVGPSIELPGADVHVGHALVELPRGDVGLLHSTQLVGSEGRARLEWMLLKPVWRD